jgi:BMFP domain-containing protein YqiC
LADFRNAAQGKAVAHKYLLIASDTFTRQAFAEPLRAKTAEITNQALKKILPHVPGGGREAAVSTDVGKEFKRMGSVLNPLDAVHREKQGKNDISVVDRTMQTLKVRLAEARANQGGSWKQNLDKVVAGYNATPHPTVHGAPETADEDNIQHFMIMQDQAANFDKNAKTHRGTEAPRGIPRSLQRGHPQRRQVLQASLRACGKTKGN